MPKSSQSTPTNEEVVPLAGVVAKAYIPCRGSVFYPFCPYSSYLNSDLNVEQDCPFDANS